MIWFKKRRRRRAPEVRPKRMHPRLKLIYGGSAVLLAFVLLYPRWYVDYGAGWIRPQKPDSQRAFLLTGPSAPTRVIRTPATRMQLQTVRVGKVKRARPDWARVWQEGAVVVLLGAGLTLLQKRRLKALDAPQPRPQPRYA